MEECSSSSFPDSMGLFLIWIRHSVKNSSEAQYYGRCGLFVIGRQDVDVSGKDSASFRKNFST